MGSNRTANGSVGGLIKLSQRIIKTLRDEVFVMNFILFAVAVFILAVSFLVIAIALNNEFHTTALPGRYF